MKELGFCSISLVILSSIAPDCSDFLVRSTSNNNKNPAAIFNLKDKEFLVAGNEQRVSENGAAIGTAFEIFNQGVYPRAAY